MFIKAQPIFVKGVENEMNRLAVFRAHGDLRGTKIKLGAADFYRIYINGKFLAAGPARTAKGYARVDILDPSELATGNDELTVAVISYHCPYTISIVLQDPFFCAEVLRDGEAVLYTGRDFDAFLPTCKIRQVERYSTQRHFAEVWDMRNGDMLTEVSSPAETFTLKNAPVFLDRVAPYPVYNDIDLSFSASRGELSYNPTLPVNKNFYSEKINEYYGIFDDSEIKYRPYGWLQSFDQNMTGGEEKLPLTLTAGQYAIFDFSQIEVGFISLCAKAAEESDLIIGFSEDASREKFEFTDMHAHTAIEYLLSKGQELDSLSFEPYGMRYAIVAVKEGSVTLCRFGIKTYMNDTGAVKTPKLDDPELELIHRAAVRSYAHNAVDLYTDCPSRERAGWLCDTYFTAQSEYEFFGSTAVEDAFLENYRLYKNEGELPRGMIPMCYPSVQLFEHGDKYIPQWAMWYIIEADDYVNRRGQKDKAPLFYDSVYGLLGFFREYENEDGLLEDLPNWNFIEWGIANSWTKNISYPTNFLYARVLDAAYNLFGDEKCKERAKQVREKTLEQSFNGKYFLDHSVRDENKKRVLCPEASEAGQYYALLFGELDLNDAKYSEFLRLIKEVFRPERNGETEAPQIAPVDLFIGAYLRIEALLMLGEWELVLRDIKGFFGSMAKETNTLWEYRRRHGSRDHGFASFAAVAINRATENLK